MPQEPIQDLLMRVNLKYGTWRYRPLCKVCSTVSSGPCGCERFARFAGLDDAGDANVASLSISALEWLPAVEIRGEGIFLGLDTEAVRKWEQQEAVRQRAKDMDDAWEREWLERHEQPPTWRITGQFVLIHTFAHALMRQLTLECGYSSSALRERLYARPAENEMAGLLIYTATSDADGTLGGLQRQGHASRLERTIFGALRAMEWCSSDPLCIHGMISGGDGLSKSACHACVLAPETACEHFNRFLDRAMLVGLPDNPEVGFFSGTPAGDVRWQRCGHANCHRMSFATS